MRLALETSSLCNRRCVTCIRNSHPDKQEIESWFKPNWLSMDIIKQALDQYARMKIKNREVCLSHFNEPLMDTRIVDIVKLAKSYNQFSLVYFDTNGDLLTKEIAKSLDGILDKIVISMYVKKPRKLERDKRFRSFFQKTKVVTLMNNVHVTTHFSPNIDEKALIFTHRNSPCTETHRRLIINHRQQFLLCCEDVIGNFALGSFPDIGLEEYWYGTNRLRIVRNLDKPKGRWWHQYCRTCPRV